MKNVNITKIHNAIDRLNDRPERKLEIKHGIYGVLFLSIILGFVVYILPPTSIKNNKFLFEPIHLEK